MSTQVTAESRQFYWPVGKPKGKHLLGKPISTWQNNVKCGRFECSQCPFRGYNAVSLDEQFLTI
jgi:hypothetical protein